MLVLGCFSFCEIMSENVSVNVLEQSASPVIETPVVVPTVPADPVITVSIPSVSPEVPVKPKRTKLVRSRLPAAGIVAGYVSETESVSSTQSSVSAPGSIVVTAIVRPVVRMIPSEHELKIQALLSPTKARIITPAANPVVVIPVSPPVDPEPVAAPNSPVIQPLIQPTRKYLNEIYKYILVSVSTEYIG